MSEILTTNKYFAAVSERTSNVFDGNSGEQYSLRSLFFRQRFAKGQYAFLRYADLQTKASESLSAERPEDFGRLIELLSPFSRDMGIHNDSENTKTIIDLQTKIDAVLRKKPKENARKQDEPDSYGYNDESKMREKGKSQVKDYGLLGRIQESVNHSRGFRDKQENDSLYEESAENCSSLVFSDPSKSRVIIFAGAGYGKSTLIQRIALAYSYNKDQTDEEVKIDKEYRESIFKDYKSDFGERKEVDTIIPCIVELRTYSAYVHDFDRCIEEAVISYSGEDYGDSVKAWINNNKQNFLLLIDGLDELTSESAFTFLKSLETYLGNNPNSRVIITTRIAGISGDVESLLRRMHFSGRTIMPMSEKEARRFCEQWVSATNDSKELLISFDRIQNEVYLNYLREFMRKPLELVMLLRSIPNQSFSSFNRWELFYNILWAEITNHIDFDDKQSIFDDECKLLSFLAYQMQINDKLSLSYDELDNMMPLIQGLSFYSNLLGQEADSDNVDAQCVWNHLKSLAYNIGIVETIEGNKTITIPIRSYQEYLVAYACYNLCLTDGAMYPDPSTILKRHINEASWLGVIGFAIAAMEYSGYSELDDFLTSLYMETENIGSLSTLVEADFSNSRTVAKALCRERFKDYSLSKEEVQLLQKCMTSKSAYSFRWALTSLYKTSFDTGASMYLEAVSYAYIFDCLAKNSDPLVTAFKLINTSVPYENTIAARILVILARIVLNEDTTKEEYLGEYVSNWTIPAEIIYRINTLAEETKSYIFVQALTELWISRIEGSSEIVGYLGDDNQKIAYKTLVDASEEIYYYFSEPNSISADYIHYLKSLINMLGMFPVKKDANEVDAGVWANAVVGAFYEYARDDIDLDQIAIAICSYHLGASYEELMSFWADDVCKGRSSSQVRKEHLSIRENNHFEMIKDFFADSENEYFRRKQDMLNTLDSSVLDTQSPPQLFAGGKDEAALRCSISRYKDGEKSNNNNLAFLIRYLEYDTLPEFGVMRTKFIRMLLKEGVSSGESYSIMNYVLLLLEMEQYSAAKQLLEYISPSEITKISEEFWYPVMWEQRRAAEGAIVCLLANRRDGQHYPEINKMEECVMETHSSWLKIL